MSIPFLTERVRFSSSGNRLVGNLHQPIEQSDAVVVVTGSWTTVKEQQAEFYARLLAGAGFTTLTFDFRGFGQSEGTPRCWENPERKSADIHAAIDFLQERQWQRIGALGICASSGYQAVNAAKDNRIISLAMIAPWLHTPELVQPYYGGPKGVAEKIEASRRAQQLFEHTQKVEFVPAISTTNPDAAMFGDYDYYLDPLRGDIPEWDKHLAVMSWEPWLRFNPLLVASQISIPVLMVHSHNGAVPDGAQQFYEELAGEKELLWISGNQLDFYDQPTQVTQALDAVVAHFQRTL